MDSYIEKGAIKVIELIGISDDSFEDAVKRGVARAAESISGMALRCGERASPGLASSGPHGRRGARAHGLGPEESARPGGDAAAQP